VAYVAATLLATRTDNAGRSDSGVFYGQFGELFLCALSLTWIDNVPHSSNNVALPKAMRRLNKQTWDELRRLFVAGHSLGQLAKRFTIPKGTLCARSAKEKWATERIENQTLRNNQITFSDDPRLAEIQAIVRDCKLAELEAEAKTAKALALKAAKAVETLEINSMDGITAAQTYRCNLWPSVAPSIMPALEAAQRGERLVISDETKKYVEQLKTLM